MLESWVFWALLAAVMQSVRTAGQKYLTGHISVYGATLVRYLFGLPFAIAYLSWLLNREGGLMPELGPVFLVSAAIAGVCQIVATILLIYLFSLRNFAVGSTYVRSEILITAIVGSVFFAEAISFLGWLAIAFSFSGLIIISLGNTGKLKSLWNRSAAYGLAAGGLFALTSLLIRRASLSLGIDVGSGGAMLPAAITLTFMVTLQTAITLVWVVVRDASEVRSIFQHWKPAMFVGLTSVIGSAGWFTAFTLERAAYVKTLGQVEFLTTLAIAVFYFRERPTKPEMIGMLFIILGVVVLLLSS